MSEWFWSLPVFLQLILAFLAVFVTLSLAVIALGLHKNIINVGDLPVTTTESASDDEENDIEDEEPVVGWEYRLESDELPIRVVVKSIDILQTVKVDIIVDLPDNATLLGIQRFYSDEYEEIVENRFVLVYKLANTSKTFTYDGSLSLKGYDISILEIVVVENPIALRDTVDSV